uniref:Uncharacterized protein n=1 Tax=Siphoviridae sp. ctOCb13 TaxID=2825477 RepID=A0A8S5Q1T2_9CAUD|nr:MAG TPA: hypothetical protein [Siphoviridae sp. ctOCb13]
MYLFNTKPNTPNPLTTLPSFTYLLNLKPWNIILNLPKSANLL